ncbi:MAG TPA: alpha/beta hydrolase-fold protein [Candidatus Solibacter sp.]|nr:alpha/beta hydrolase-fold protein [Candidatus Solibacter sp.]
MRISILTVFAIVPAASAWAQQPAQPPAQPPALRSPEVDSTRRVTFRLRAPKAGEVSVSGEFLDAGKSLQKDDQGVWSVTIGPVAPEIYNYNFTIDGVRTIDPNNPNVKTGSTPGTIASILEVPGEGPAFYDGQAVPHGEIHTHWYQSKSLNALRRVTVYTPPGYDQSAPARYPVLYLFHGANADETAWTRLGHVNLILDNLLAAGKAKPFVVVMPFGYGVPPGTPASAPGDNTTLFSRDLIEDVIPAIQSKYRVNTSRDQRAIAGLSMGGGESLGIGLNHLDLFSYVAGFSAALRPPGFPKTFAGLVANPQEANQKLHLLWVGCGNQDSLFAPAKSFSAFLEEHQIKHTFRETPGAHTWMVWRRYLNELAPLLFQ